MKRNIDIQEQVDILAPAEEVFAILVDPEKHLQLGPDWGQARISQISDDYPQPGSSYLLLPIQEEDKPYSTIVGELDWLRRITFQAENDSRYAAIWEIETLEDSVRLSYQANFLLEAGEDEPETSTEVSDDALEAVLNQPESFERKARIARREAAEWLTSIKRYAELRETRLRLWLRWLMDRYILRLRSDQRRVILALLAMQIITCLTFVAAVVGIGLASLLF